MAGQNVIPCSPLDIALLCAASADRRRRRPGAGRVSGELAAAPRSLWLALLGLIVPLGVLGGTTGAAHAQGVADASIKHLNKQALDAFDNLNFDQSKTLLEQALAEADSAGLAKEAVAARTHLHLGMLMIAGFQKHDEAVEQFRTALRIQPDIVPTPGLFNPEVQAVFDESKAALRAEPKPTDSTPRSKSAARRQPANALPDLGVTQQDARRGEDGQKFHASDILLSIGVGSGFGTAKGHLDANNNVSHVTGTPTPTKEDNSWSGGLAPSQLLHLSLGAGYFVSPDLLLGLDGRIQFITGTTSAPTGGSPPSTAVAVLARASWYLSRAPLRPFVSGGLGAGAIRQVVKLKTLSGDPLMDCGSKRTEPCVDTVTGGPLFLALGGGLAYQLGSFSLLASVTANVGVPRWMLNVDAQVGLGFRL